MGLAGQTNSGLNYKRLGFKPQQHRSIYSRNCRIYYFLLYIEHSLIVLKQAYIANIIPPHLNKAASVCFVHIQMSECQNYTIVTW